MTLQSIIRTRFLVISDTHNFQFDNEAGNSFPLQLPTAKADVLLHCGDLTQVGGVSSFRKALHMLGSIQAELKLVIAGNHDLELDEEYWNAQCTNEEDSEDPDDHIAAVDTMTGIQATRAGIVFLNEGTYAFTLNNGAIFKIYVSPYTPAFGDWAFAYQKNEDRFNSSSQSTDSNHVSIAKNPIPNDVNIIMTHGPPQGILDWCPQGNVGCENLLQAIRRVRPVMHCFGHIHEGHGIEIISWNEPVTRQKKDESAQPSLEKAQIENPYPLPYGWTGNQGEQTLAINASIMTGEYKPENPPWLIDVDLPCDESLLVSQGSA